MNTRKEMLYSLIWELIFKAFTKLSIHTPYTQEEPRSPLGIMV